jgi:peptidoglycan/LPS O-acetylase OafA/YrhL
MMTTVPLQPNRSTSARLGFLDGIRGIAALYVVLFHFLALDQAGLPTVVRGFLALVSFGHMSVCVFIVLSGFSLMLPVAQSPEGELAGGFWGYIRRRARRILPPYYASIALSMVVLYVLNVMDNGNAPYDVAHMMPSAATVATHALLLHNLSNHWIDKINIATWSIATEWQAYFVFALLLLPVWRRSNDPIVGVTASVIVGFAVGLLPALVPNHDFESACFWFFGLFAIGMAAAVAFVRIRNASSKMSNINVRLAVMAIAGILVYVYLLRIMPAHVVAQLGPLYTRDYVCHAVKDSCVGVIAAAAILHCALNAGTEKANSALHNMMASRFARFLGSFSYSLYLSHGIILLIATNIACQLRMEPFPGFLLKLFVFIPFAVVFAYGFYICFERPLLSRARPTASLPDGGAGVPVSTGYELPGG